MTKAQLLESQGRLPATGILPCFEPDPPRRLRAMPGSNRSKPACVERLSGMDGPKGRRSFPSRPLNSAAISKDLVSPKIRRKRPTSQSPGRISTERFGYAGIGTGQETLAGYSVPENRCRSRTIAVATPPADEVQARGCFFARTRPIMPSIAVPNSQTAAGTGTAAGV